MPTKKKTSAVCAKQRGIFGEMLAGVEEMKAHREGKITLRSYKKETAPLPPVDAKIIRETRNSFHYSRGVFARCLRINERTLEKWEQGLGKPNKQAAALILLARKYPDTLERLEELTA
jgi:putative transcriptional regulator